MKREYFKIKGIGNYYGGLFITKENDKYYWIIENYDTDLDDINEWIEIPESLYKELFSLI